MLCLSGFEIYSRWVSLGTSTNSHLTVQSYQRSLEPAS